MTLEDALEAAFGDRIREEEVFPCEVWSALCNTDWIDPAGEAHSYSFREAGGVIAELRGEGTYDDWYCCTTPGIVTPEIAVGMAAIGWRHQPIVL